MNENDQLRQVRTYPCLPLSDVVKQALEEQKFLIDERLSDEEVTHIQFRSMEDEIASLKQHISELDQRL